MLFIAHLRLPKRSVRTVVAVDFASADCSCLRRFSTPHFSSLPIDSGKDKRCGYAVLACAGCTAFKMRAKSGKKQSRTGKVGERRLVHNTIGCACKKATKKALIPLRTGKRYQSHHLNELYSTKLMQSSLLLKSQIHITE